MASGRFASLPDSPLQFLDDQPRVKKILLDLVSGIKTASKSVTLANKWLFNSLSDEAKQQLASQKATFWNEDEFNDDDPGINHLVHDFLNATLWVGSLYKPHSKQQDRILEFLTTSREMALCDDSEELRDEKGEASVDLWMLGNLSAGMSSLRGAVAIIYHSKKYKLDAVCTRKLTYCQDELPEVGEKAPNLESLLARLTVASLIDSPDACSLVQLLAWSDKHELWFDHAEDSVAAAAQWFVYPEESLFVWKSCSGRGRCSQCREHSWTITGTQVWARSFQDATMAHWRSWKAIFDLATRHDAIRRPVRRMAAAALAAMESLEESEESEIMENFEEADDQ